MELPAYSNRTQRYGNDLLLDYNAFPLYLLVHAAFLQCSDDTVGWVTGWGGGIQLVQRLTLTIHKGSLEDPQAPSLIWKKPLEK